MDFESPPSRYRHWKLAIAGDTARLTLSVNPDAPFVPGYTLKLNSYDLGVDIELHDAMLRLRFEHPEVHVVILDSDRDRVFSAGANIPMLASSSHSFKVNFCKYTNETRPMIQDASARGAAQTRCPHAPARAPAAVTSWRSPATRSSSPMTARRRCRSPRCRSSASSRAPAGSPA